MASASDDGSLTLALYLSVLCERTRTVALPTVVALPFFVRRSVTLIVALRVLEVEFVTRPESVKLCPGAALLGGELSELSLVGGALAAWAAAGARSARPTGTAMTSRRAGANKETTSSYSAEAPDLHRFPTHRTISINAQKV